ncbi:MAG: hypothetical protein AAGE01_18325, partial [Pseudomonadota bacterium]
MSQNDRTTRVRLRSRFAALGWGAWGALAATVVGGIWLAVLQPLSRAQSIEETVLAIPPEELRELSSRGQLP